MDVHANVKWYDLGKEHHHLAQLLYIYFEALLCRFATGLYDVLLT